MNNPIKKFVCGATAAVMLTVAVPMARAATPFTDVPSDSWYVNFVDYAYNHKLMAGTSDTTFSPNQTMTRGMLVTVLHSIAGKPSHSGSNPFSDVGDAWYRNAVLWCYENGIVAGTSATTFSPEKIATREQCAVMLMRLYDKRNTAKTQRMGVVTSMENLPDISGFSAIALGDAQLAFSGKSRIVGSMGRETVDSLRTASGGAKILLRFTFADKNLGGIAVQTAAEQMNLEMVRGGYDGIFLDFPKLRTASDGKKLHELAEKLDRMLENGMAISVGRLREDPLFDYKFVCCSHNTLRGAAGGGVLLAELLAAKGYLD